MTAAQWGALAPAIVALIGAITAHIRISAHTKASKPK